MAKSKDVQLIPSGGVLVAALIAAVIAAILVNVYVANVRSAYLTDAKTVMQFVRDVPQGTIVDGSLLVPIKIPVRLNKDGVFDTAVTEDDFRGLIVGKPAPRTFFRGDILFQGDANPSSRETLPEVPPGHMLVEIKISPDTHISKAIRPGSYVQILGDFNGNADPKAPPAIKVLTVIKSVKVVLIDGEATVAPSAGSASKSISSISVILKDDVGKQLLEYEKRLASKRFMIEPGPLPSVPDAAVSIEKETVTFFQNLARMSASGSAASVLP